MVRSFSWWGVLGLLTVVLVSESFGQAPAGLKDRLATIIKAQEEASRRYHQALRGKTTAAETQPAVDRFTLEVDRNTQAVLDLVRANPGDPATVEALTFVIRVARAGPGDSSYQAMALLLKDHVRDDGMGDLCGGLFIFVHSTEAEVLLRSVMSQHPNTDDRGKACHALAYYLARRARMVRAVRENPGEIDRYVGARFKASTDSMIKSSDLDALEHEVETLLERCVGEFASLKYANQKQTMGVIAAGELFAMRYLTVGKVAPEIQGKDQDGKPFLLGDYRGKVVVLTFSGNWCGPCVAMYPQERDLVARLAGQPFAMVSVNTDEDVETLKTSIASGDVSWRCWWDGGTEGPITTRWGISSFPSIFVLDPSGVIRFKDIRGEKLDRAVISLIDEARKANPPGP